MPSRSRIACTASDTSWILARDQARRHFHDGHAAPEAAVHLRELEPDVAATEDHQVLRQEVDIHHRGAGQEIDLARPR